MCASLHAGESTYSLSDTQALRGHLAKQGETLDLLSKKIANIPVNPNVPRAQTLQTAIRRSTSNFIKDSILSLPSLPTAAELLEKRNRFKNDDLPFVANSQVVRPPKYATMLDTGWSPVPKSQDVITDVSSDPLIQQINIVKGFIQQARSAMRFEEVASLEANLRELQEALYQQSIAESKNSDTSDS